MGFGPAHREEILAQLFSILGGMSDFVSKVRNRGLLDNDARPAVALLDGDERQRIAAQRGGGRMAPSILQMTPQVFILLKTKKPVNENVGQDLNSLRVKVIQAFANDATLRTLVGANGDMTYDGCDTDLKTGASMEGQMQMFFTISTAFNPYAT